MWIKFLYDHCSIFLSHPEGGRGVIVRHQIVSRNISYCVVSVTSINLLVAGRVAEEKLFTEEDWSREDNCIPYEKSKFRAEKAAWELVQSLPGNYKDARIQRFRSSFQ